MEEFEIVIDGYWREPNKNRIPNYSGIFFVYTADFNEHEKNVALHRLIYIGYGDDVHTAIEEAVPQKNWQLQLGDAQVLYFSVARVDASIAARITATLLYHFRPICNGIDSNEFPYESTEVTLHGKTGLLDTHVQVECLS